MTQLESVDLWGIMQAWNGCKYRNRQMSISFSKAKERVEFCKPLSECQKTDVGSGGADAEGLQ